VQKDGEWDHQNSNRKRVLSLLNSYFPIACRKVQNAQPDTTGPWQVGKTKLLLEIDAAFQVSWGVWAIEIKTGGFNPYDLKGLIEFCRRNTKFRPWVITASGDESIARRVACWPSVGRNSWSTVHLNPSPEAVIETSRAGLQAILE